MAPANTLVATLLAMAGQRNIITVPRAFVQFTGSLEAAMMLNQLLYWMPRTHAADETVYKTDADWRDELCLTRYAVRTARERLVAMGFLSTEVHHVRGAPAVHYRIDYEVLLDRWTSWLQDKGVKSENELYSPPSKVRFRTLLPESDESSSNSNRVTSENEQYMNKVTKTTSKNHDHHHHEESIDRGGGGGGGGGGGDFELTETERYLLSEGFGDESAYRFRNLDLEACKRDIRKSRASGQQEGGIIRRWRRSPPQPAPHTIADYRPPAPLANAPSRAESGRKLRALAAERGMFQQELTDHDREEPPR